MAAAYAAQKAFGGCQLQRSLHRQSSNVDASLDVQASTSGRFSAPFQGGIKGAKTTRAWSLWSERVSLTSKKELLLHAVGRKGRCQCKQAGLPWRYCRPLSQQRRDFLAWCIAALVGGQVGAAYGLDLGVKSGALVSNAVCQQPVVKGPVEVSVLPHWSGVDAGHIIEDGGYPPTVVKAPGRRVLASGDFHGDLRAARRTLELAGVLSQDRQDRWTGGSSVFVQVGDVLDRGDDEIAIMSLLAHLSRQASAAGGALYQVCGNHETMNVYGDFRYVTEEGFKEGEWFDQWAREKYGGDHMAAFQNWYKEALLAREQLRRAPSPSWNPLLANRPRRVRQQLFEPGGPLARVMAGYSTVLQVNDSLFAHGGVLPHHVEYGLGRLNREVSRWMLGQKDRITGEPQEQPFLATRGYNSVMWSRLYSREEYDTGAERDLVCLTLAKALRLVPGVKRLVVGHTPQETGANSECNGRIWRIDVGMSSGILQATPQVLEISGSDVRVLSAETADDLWVASYI